MPDAKTTNPLELDYTAPSPDRFAGTMRSTVTSSHGKTVIDLKMSGTWLGARCPADDAEREDAEDASGD